MTRSSLIVIAVALLFAASIVQNARRKRTSERHALGWLLVCAGMVGLAVWRPAIDGIARLMGIHYAPSALFFVVCAGLLFLVYRQSLELAEHRERLKRLAQEVALLSGAEKEPEERKERTL